MPNETEDVQPQEQPVISKSGLTRDNRRQADKIALNTAREQERQHRAVRRAHRKG